MGKKHLRQIGEPICLFGEGPADRRERLRNLLAILGEDAIKRKWADEPKPKETPAAKEARRWLTEYSLPRARDRVLKERSDANLPESAKLARLQEVQRLAKGLAPHCRLRIKELK